MEPIAPGDFSQMMETYKKAVDETEAASCRDFRLVIDRFFFDGNDVNSYFPQGRMRTKRTLYSLTRAAVRREVTQMGRDEAAKNLTARIVAAIEACPETDEAIYI